MEHIEKYNTGICLQDLVKENLYLSTYHVGNGSSCIIPSNKSVFLVDEEKDTCRQIVDKWGNIRNFPGIDYCSVLVSECGGKITPEVKYDASFGKLPDGRFFMIWTVRPDGSYWMDSFGFGEEDEDSVTLYTVIDGEGNFLQPFKLYSIGEKKYCQNKIK